MDSGNDTRGDCTDIEDQRSTSRPRPRGWAHDESEHDACAIIANVKKDGRASHGNVKRTLEALVRMGHRTGEIEGEGDGAGLQTDIPREWWARRLEARELSGSLARRPHLTVAHLMIPYECAGEAEGIKRRALDLFAEHGFHVLVAESARVRSSALGPLAHATEPEFWQVVALPADRRSLNEREIFDIQLRLERELPLHVASLSQNSAVYKARSDAETLRRYFPELAHPDFKSAITLGHARYSTNTDSRAERAQMFSTLGHNGEINSIDRLGREAIALGFQLPERASDSQILDRVVESLMFDCDLTLMHALEVVFPPVWSEVEQLSPELRELYKYIRRAFGAYAQGPAAIIARQGDEIVFSSDALGLRPLWFGETEKEFFASSEKGVVPLDHMVCDPKPLAPGEKMGFLLLRGHGVRTFSYADLLVDALTRFRERFRLADLNARTHWYSASSHSGRDAESFEVPDLDQKRLLAFGWNKLDDGLVSDMADSGKEPISGLGWDGPLAVLSEQRKNLSDYFHERVAVVTNPAIDREREAEHFSTRVFLGARPSLAVPTEVEQVELLTPLLLGGVRDDETEHTEIARGVGCRTLAEVLALAAPARQTPEVRAAVAAVASASTTFADLSMVATSVSPGSVKRDDSTSRLAPQSSSFDLGHEVPSPFSGALRAATIDLAFGEDEPLEHALQRLEQDAVDSVRGGATVLVLDDARAFAEGRIGMDAHLALAAVDARLRAERVDSESSAGESLRRRASLVLRAGSLRNVHDVVFALGCGADAVNPYALFEVALRGATESDDRRARLRKCVSAVQSGVEKVLSTMGIHELDGYGRLFASIGLAPDVAEYFGMANYCGSADAGLSLRGMNRDARERMRLVSGEVADSPKAKRALTLPNEHRAQPSLWKAVGNVARGDQPYEMFAARLRENEETRPVALRHLLDIKAAAGGPARAADTRAGRHGAPFYISAMSFGSQGETSFRAYAEAAKRLDILCINGEGGELPDLIGKYPDHRGQQVASGRFGVNARLLNSCYLLEIKIGQGAKPGEGGMLPGFKVTARIAETRHTPPGIDLISPSNNHDIYSIEDLAQVIEELKTVNPRARISVKIPSVPHIGPIATGIAKARADVVAISGYDGGTGAARKHSLRHTGLPVEIGLREAHRALVRAGLRDRVELWADGGVKSGRDVVKLMLLGADRVGFGTMAMAAIGCTSCRECNTGTCHVGITSQLKSPDEALAAGQKHFTPREYERAVDHLVRFFSALREEIASEAARAGFERTSDLVGRTDALEQARCLDRVDLEWLLKPGQPCQQCLDVIDPRVGRARRSLTSLTRVISNSVVELAYSGKEVVYYEDNLASSTDRALGTHLAGTLVRRNHGAAATDSDGPDPRPLGLKRALLNFYEGSVPGNGLGAFNAEGVEIVVRGGAQDGAAKGASGGRVIILKGVNHDGESVDGSVGKCFAYGAQAGLFVVQGDADSRAGIRLSGADLVLGGRLRGALQDEVGHLAVRANIKGFAFEYMTSGRGLVLGDPGPWLCSGMTGGVVYVLTDEALGLTKEAVSRRLAIGARVRVEPVDASDEGNLLELLGHYRQALVEGEQFAEADDVSALEVSWQSRFVRVVPANAAKAVPRTLPVLPA
jgi:glutamate synthase (NADPH) large chain